LRRSPLPKASPRQSVHPQPLFFQPQRKKLPLKKAKRKAPRVVLDEEADESTEDGLVYKRKRRVVIEPPAIESAAPDYVENPPTLPCHSSPPGMFLLQTPQLLKPFLNNLLIRKPLLKPPKNSLPHHYASRLPPPSNLVRVVVSTNLRLLHQHRAFQLPSKRP